jgi:hypothetical protein
MVYAAMMVLGAGELVVFPVQALLGRGGGIAALSLGRGLGCWVLGVLRRLPTWVAALFAVAGLGGTAGLPFALVATLSLSDPRWLVFPGVLGVVLTIVLDINWPR